jgi:hypothetical protein
MATCSSLRGLVCQRGELRGEQTEIWNDKALLVNYHMWICFDFFIFCKTIWKLNGTST